MDTTTHARTNLTSSPASDENDPQFSPDGTRIVYAGNATGPTGIWLMNADGSGQQPVSVLTGYYDRSPQ
jgi:Tol biopolymer transport system component